VLGFGDADTRGKFEQALSRTLPQHSPGPDFTPMEVDDTPAAEPPKRKRANRPP
jgi:hypothetical protein